ncbi:MAG: OmpH family outer membrane protein [Holosporaceae bacterium]|jgi:Skp family chaperone for outer membrane proteins|nr:OmpH family outer membrane protein [Holosporaceae bacterium]
MNSRFLTISLVLLIFGTVSLYVYKELDYSSARKKPEKKDNNPRNGALSSTFSTVTASFGSVNDSDKAVVSGMSGVAIVDIKEVASKSMAGKSIEKQLIEINNKSEKVFSDLEARVKKMESQQTSPENTRKTEDMNAVLYELVRDRRLQISMIYKEAIVTLRENIKKAIAEVSQNENIKLVMDSEAIIYHAADFLDITKDVIKAMNKMCSEISMKLKKKRLANIERLKDFSELSEFVNSVD